MKTIQVDAADAARLLEKNKGNEASVTQRSENVEDRRLCGRRGRDSNPRATL